VGKSLQSPFRAGMLILWICGRSPRGRSSGKERSAISHFLVLILWAEAVEAVCHANSFSLARRVEPVTPWLKQSFLMAKVWPKTSR
jgi:hypothetical protein